MVYGRTIDGKDYTFGVSGKLYRNGLVMFDRQTDSLWLHITGEGIKGEMKGKQLPLVATAGMSRWKDWRRAHPDTTVLTRRGREDFPDRYETYHESDQTGVRPLKNRDERLGAKEMVLGVRVGGLAKAYPHARMKNAPLIVDTIGETAVVVFHEADTGLTVAYDAGGRKFESMLDGSRARAGETVWDLRTGREVRGDGVLTPLPAINAYWFAWADYYPKTEIHE